MFNLLIYYRTRCPIPHRLFNISNRFSVCLFLFLLLVYRQQHNSAIVIKNHAEFRQNKKAGAIMTPGLNGATLHFCIYIRFSLKIAIFEERIRKNPNSFLCCAYRGRRGQKNSCPKTAAVRGQRSNFLLYRHSSGRTPRTCLTLKPTPASLFA